MASPPISLRALDGTAFRTSKRADGINDKLKSALGLSHRYEPARLAIGRSLALPDPPPPMSGDDEDESGKPIPGKTLFGDEDFSTWVALIVERSGAAETTIEAMQEHVRRHWHRGSLLLEAEWNECEAKHPDQVYERFILALARQAGLPATGESPTVRPETPVSEAASPTGGIVLRLGTPGTAEKTGQVVTWVVNGKGSPHVALMGGTGSGKTRLARDLLSQLRQKARIPVLLFDFKGDLAGNTGLVSDLGAATVRPPYEAVPLDVLRTADDSQIELTNAAMRFRESFVRIPAGSKPGPMQQDMLRDAAKNALARRQPGRPVELTDVRNELEAIYQSAERKSDIVTSTFNDLTQEGWNLFRPRLRPAEFFAESWIIDVHEAPETAQRLVVFLILDALYGHVRALQDSPLDATGHRAMRMVLVVDEARRVLQYGQPSLVGLVRESRSKGLSIFLISQSPDDYDTGDDNFLEQIGLTMSFRANSESPRALKACLGQAVDLAGLPDGVAVTRLAGQTGVSRIKAWE